MIFAAVLGSLSAEAYIHIESQIIAMSTSESVGLSTARTSKTRTTCDPVRLVDQQFALENDPMNIKKLRAHLQTFQTINTMQSWSFVNAVDPQHPHAKKSTTLEQLP